MPYVVSLRAMSPYVPHGLEVIDYTPGSLVEPITVNGEFIVSVLNSGTPMDPERVPRRYSVDVKAETLPDVFSLSLGHGVTDRFREKVEELEPGVHQFFPVEITAKGGEHPEKRHWFLNICNRVDAIDPDKTGLPLRPNRRSYSRELISEETPMDMVLRKHMIAGMCMWIDRRFTGYFFSDELFDFVEKNGLTKLQSWHVEAE